ncbi:MAG: SRPBCC family protein [Candidatus Thermoplasmatota archaeon]
MHAEAKAHVPLPVPAAWQRLADLSALSQWAPDVAGSPAEAIRPGATRWARLYEPTYGKDVLIERITDVDPRRHTFSYDIEGGIGPLAAIRTTWSVAPADGGSGSTVTVSSEITLTGSARFVPFLVKRAWTRQLQDLVDGFAKWAGRLQGDVEVMDGPQQDLAPAEAKPRKAKAVARRR